MGHVAGLRATEARRAPGTPRTADEPSREEDALDDADPDVEPVRRAFLFGVVRVLAVGRGDRRVLVKLKKIFGGNIGEDDDTADARHQHIERQHDGDVDVVVEVEDDPEREAGRGDEDADVVQYEVDLRARFKEFVAHAEEAHLDVACLRAWGGNELVSRLVLAHEIANS